MGNPKYFGYPQEIQIIIGFPTQNGETRKTYHSALRAHIFYTSSKGKTVGVEFQQILFIFHQ